MLQTDVVVVGKNAAVPKNGGDSKVGVTLSALEVQVMLVVDPAKEIDYPIGGHFVLTLEPKP